LSIEAPAKGSASAVLRPALIPRLEETAAGGLFNRNASLRGGEIKNLKWLHIDLEKKFLTVGRSKTEAGEGRCPPQKCRPALSTGPGRVASDPCEAHAAVFSRAYS
jgi:integrase